MKKLGTMLLLAISLSVSMVLGGCIDTSAFDDGYDLGDLSVTYCASTTPEQRDVLRGQLNLVASEYGLNVGLDYCKAFETLKDGYELGDVTRIWCNSTDELTRSTLRHAFAAKYDLNGVVLTDSYCEVAGYVLPPQPSPE